MWHIDCHFLTLVLECKQFLFILPATAIYYHTYITFTNILVSLLLLRGCGGDTLTKSSLKEKGFSLAHSSGSLFIIAGKSKQQGHLNSWSGHTHSQERERKHAHFHSAHSSLLYNPGPNLRNGATHSGLVLPTLVNVIKTIPHKHSHWPPWPPWLWLTSQMILDQVSWLTVKTNHSNK